MIVKVALDKEKDAHWLTKENHILKNLSLM